MCTVILGTRVFEDAPVFVASNRDELLSRPSEGPKLRKDGEFRTVTPLDLQEGGTWMGLNEAGVMVALTNRFGAPRNGAKRSRGELVSNALQNPNALKAAELIDGLAASDYNPFHLVAADSETAYVVWSDGERMHFDEIPPGFFVVTERSFDAAHTEREVLLQERLGVMQSNDALGFDDFRGLLSIREPDSLDGTDIYVPDMNYGTKSSTILQLGTESYLKYADGPPNSTEYEDRTDLLRELGL